jgi:large subunit ribosomal protein L13
LSQETIVIDASNHVLGRLASYAAKKALQGNMVVVLNAEKAVISGKKKSILAKAKRRLETRTHAAQFKAPVHPRRADTYLRRAIRGMLPWKLSRGKAAFNRVRVYIGVPEEFSKMTPQRLAAADASRLRARYMSLGELSSEIGKVTQ